MAKMIMTAIYNYPILEKFLALAAGMVTYYTVKYIDNWREENGYVEKEEA
ncbi:MAG: hypothetical protein J6Y02_01175 [Pseudobutyrivibrio sp.]|nr:hypothetical protein [Pseudobutyrivibrio sp.]